MHQAVPTTAPSSVTTWSLSYPASVKIARTSPWYFRVAEPTTKLDPSITFTLRGSSAFDVTRTEGIVYVSDEIKLQSEPDIIQWVHTFTINSPLSCSAGIFLVSSQSWHVRRANRYYYRYTIDFFEHPELESVNEIENIRLINLDIANMEELTKPE